MSTPILNFDKLEDLQLYAPPWAREQPAALPKATPAKTFLPKTTPPKVAPPKAAPTQAVPTPAAQPRAKDAAATVPLMAGADAESEGRDGDAQSSPSARPQAADAQSQTADARPQAADARPKVAESPPKAPPTRRARFEWQLPEADQPAKRPLPRMAPGVGGPNLDWCPSRIDWPSSASRLPPFEGDVAVKALRHRLSLDPQVPPAPPVRVRQKSLLPFLGRFSVVSVVVATVAYAILFHAMPEMEPLSLKQGSGTQEQSVVAAKEPSFAETLATAHASTPATPRMVIEGRQAFANEPLPLGVSFIGVPDGEVVVLTGLVVGTTLSLGTAQGDTGWRLAARDLTRALAYAPKDFVGVMNAAIDLRTPKDSIVDRNVMRLEWIGKQPDMQVRQPRLAPDETVPAVSVSQAIDQDEIATLLKRGLDYLKSGDIAAARLVLLRAAHSGSPQATLALGATFDPFVFGELGVLGFAADAAQARAWYERAGRLGATEAAPRIERLTRLGR